MMYLCSSSIVLIMTSNNGFQSSFTSKSEGVVVVAIVAVVAVVVVGVVGVAMFEDLVK